MRATLRSRASLFCLLLALIVAASAAPQADGQQAARKPTTLTPLAADAESRAFGINDRGYVVGHSSSANDGAGTMSTASLRSAAFNNPLSAMKY